MLLYACIVYVHHEHYSTMSIAKQQNKFIATSVDDKDIDDSGQQIEDTKALNLAVFCSGILEQCMRTCCRNMRLRSESNAGLLTICR